MSAWPCAARRGDGTVLLCVALLAGAVARRWARLVSRGRERGGPGARRHHAGSRPGTLTRLPSSWRLRRDPGHGAPRALHGAPRRIDVTLAVPTEGPTHGPTRTRRRPVPTRRGLVRACTRNAVRHVPRVLLLPAPRPAARRDGLALRPSRWACRVLQWLRACGRDPAGVPRAAPRDALARAASEQASTSTRPLSASGRTSAQASPTRGTPT
jgi:hypothetical protein